MRRCSVHCSVYAVSLIKSHTAAVRRSLHLNSRAAAMSSSETAVELLHRVALWYLKRRVKLRSATGPWEHQTKWCSTAEEFNATQQIKAEEWIEERRMWQSRSKGNEKAARFVRGCVCKLRTKPANEIRQKCICVCLQGGRGDSDKSTDAQLYSSVLDLTFSGWKCMKKDSMQFLSTGYWLKTDTSMGHLWFHLEYGCLPVLWSQQDAERLVTENMKGEVKLLHFFSLRPLKTEPQTEAFPDMLTSFVVLVFTVVLCTHK